MRVVKIMTLHTIKSTWPATKLSVVAVIRETRRHDPGIRGLCSCGLSILRPDVHVEVRGDALSGRGPPIARRLAAQGSGRLAGSRAVHVQATLAGMEDPRLGHARQRRTTAWSGVGLLPATEHSVQVPPVDDRAERTRFKICSPWLQWQARHHLSDRRRAV